MNNKFILNFVLIFSINADVSNCVEKLNSVCKSNHGVKDANALMFYGENEASIRFTMDIDYGDKNIFKSHVSYYTTDKQAIENVKDLLLLSKKSGNKLNFSDLRKVLVSTFEKNFVNIDSLKCDSILNEEDKKTIVNKKVIDELLKSEIPLCDFCTLEENDVAFFYDNKDEIKKAIEMKKAEEKEKEFIYNKSFTMSSTIVELFSDESNFDNHSIKDKFNSAINEANKEALKKIEEALKKIEEEAKKKGEKIKKAAKKALKKIEEKQAAEYLMAVRDSAKGPVPGLDFVINN